MERIEVLKGLQSARHGRSASGGAINLIRERPELGEFDVSTKVEVGGYDDREFGYNIVVNGALNTPFGEHTA